MIQLMQKYKKIQRSKYTQWQVGKVEHFSYIKWINPDPPTSINISKLLVQLVSDKFEAAKFGL